MLTQINARNRGIAESRKIEQVTSLDLSTGELCHRSTLNVHLTKVLPFRGGLGEAHRSSSTCPQNRPHSGISRFRNKHCGSERFVHCSLFFTL